MIKKIAIFLFLVTPSLHARVSFEEVNARVFQKHCVECHNDKKSKGGLNLTLGGLSRLKNLTEEEKKMSLMTSGQLSLVPGSPEDSAIYFMSEDRDMPEKKNLLEKPVYLNEEELELLYNWIAEGAETQ